MLSALKPQVPIPYTLNLKPKTLNPSFEELRVQELAVPVHPKAG